MSSLASVIEGMPYWRDRKPISCSSLMKFRRTRIEPSLSVLPFCSAEGLRKLLFGDEPLGDEEVAEATDHRLPELHLRP